MRTAKDYAFIARKITAVLFLSQGLSSAGFIAAFTVHALVGIELSGRPAMAGVPGAVYVLGQALGAFIWSYGMESMGRRRGIGSGQIIGAVGSIIAVWAIMARSFPFFLAGLVFVGIARSAVDLGRFAAAEVHLPDSRGRAISNVVLGSTVGAIVGPLLVGPMGRLAAGAGLAELAGSYLLSLAVLLAAASLIFSGLRPEPRDIGREIAAMHAGQLPSRTARPLRQIVRQPEIIAAGVTMIFAQMVMMVPMCITSVHMKMHLHSLTAISLVISAHAVGMYAFSVLSGRMTDRLGRQTVIVMGSTLLAVSCLMGAPAVGFAPLVVSLFLLGVGWNFAYVAGSALLADQLAPGERARAQGLNDFVLNLASAGSQAASGVIYAQAGFGVMCLAAGAMALVPLCAVLWLHVPHRSAESSPAAE
jgi:MFS family permease